MGQKYLGNQFDIHTGGIDHIPTHHENEIAQSKGRTGKIPARYWLHCEFLQVDGGKMSKSLGNVYTITDLEEIGVEPLAYKMFCFTAHYRTKLNFTFESIKSAQKSLQRLREGYLKHLESNNNIVSSNEKIKEYRFKFLKAINDDMNMPVAMSVLWDIIKEKEKSKIFAELILEFDQVLGLDLKKIKKQEKNNLNIPKEIEELIEQREKARKEKNWIVSDKIREEIKEKGYIIKDTKQGFELERIEK